MWIFVNLREILGKGIGGGLIMAILCIYPFIHAINYIDFCTHKNQVIIEETVCEGFSYDASGNHGNGVDYLNFNIDVTFKKKEVSRFTVHTVVLKNGKYVGYIKTDFEGNCRRMDENVPIFYYDTQTRQTLKFNMSHDSGTSWSGKELMKEIYDGDLEDYSFESEVIMVNFTDGTMVGRFLLFDNNFYYDENGKFHYDYDFWES